MTVPTVLATTTPTPTGAQAAPAPGGSGAFSALLAALTGNAPSATGGPDGDPTTDPAGDPAAPASAPAHQPKHARGESDHADNPVDAPPQPALPVSTAVPATAVAAVVAATAQPVAAAQPATSIRASAPGTGTDRAPEPATSLAAVTPSDSAVTSSDSAVTPSDSAVTSSDSASTPSAIDQAPAARTAHATTPTRHSAGAAPSSPLLVSSDQKSGSISASRYQKAAAQAEPVEHAQPAGSAPQPPSALATAAPTQPATPAPATVQTAPASAMAHAQPQLTEAIAHLRTRGPANTELSIALHPAELGAVHVRAALHGDTLTVTVACADEAARQAVTAALPDLHHALGGLGSIDVDLRDAGRGQHAPAEPDQRERRDQPGSQDGYDQNQNDRPRHHSGRTTDDGLDRWM